MAVKNFRRRFAFSVVELLVAITILGVIAGTITLSANSIRQTAKDEAERIASFLRKATLKFGRERANFDLNFVDKNPGKTFFDVTDNATGKLYDPHRHTDGKKHSYILTKGCTLESNIASTNFKGIDNTFSVGLTLTITDAEGEKHYIKIYAQGGRIRTTPNNSDE